MAQNFTISLFINGQYYIILTSLPLQYVVWETMAFLNMLRPEQNIQHFADDPFNGNLFDEKYNI